MNTLNIMIFLILIIINLVLAVNDLEECRYFSLCLKLTAIVVGVVAIYESI